MRPEAPQNFAPLLGLGLGIEVGHPACLLKGSALVNQQGGIAAVVNNQVGTIGIGPGEHLLRGPPVFLQAFALPGEDGGALGMLRRAVRPDGDGSRGLVLSREDVAARPADPCAQSHERLDEDGGLDGHVQRAADADAFQRLRRAVAGAQSHEAGHFLLSQLDFLSPQRVQREIADFEGGTFDLMGHRCDSFAG